LRLVSSFSCWGISGDRSGENRPGVGGGIATEVERWVDVDAEYGENRPGVGGGIATVEEFGVGRSFSRFGRIDLE